MTIFVGNLPYTATESDVEGLFKVKASARIIFDRETNRSKGFGFVDFDTAETAKAELAKIQTKPVSLQGRTLVFGEAEKKSGGKPQGNRQGGGQGGGHQPRRNNDREARNRGYAVEENFNR